MPRGSLQADRRQGKLAKMLSRGQSISISSQADRFGVHPMTVRRDLDALESEGLLVRCYGGAIPAQRIAFEFAFGRRRRRHHVAKRRIGFAASKMIDSRRTVILDTGTTTLEIARGLSKAGTSCTVITSSLVIAGELWASEPVELMLLGGRVRRNSPDLVGPGVELMLEKLAADVAFLGADGIDPKRGCFTIDVEAARVAERMAASARRVIVVADSSKLGSAGPVRYLQIKEMDELITDKGARPPAVASLRRQGVKVTIV